MTHALVVGGGIAGAATALALGKAGVTSTVYEAYPSGGDDVGAFLMVMHNGMGVPGQQEGVPGPDELASRFTDDTPRRVLLAKQDEVLATAIHRLPDPLPRWHNSRLVLVGDAAHLSATSAAQGASIALEDSVILAMCVRDIPDLEQAFARYQQIRAPRVRRLAEMVAKPVRTQEEATDNAKPEVRGWLYEHEIHWEEAITLA